MTPGVKQPDGKLILNTKFFFNYVKYCKQKVYTNQLSIILNTSQAIERCIEIELLVMSNFSLMHVMSNIYISMIKILILFVNLNTYMYNLFFTRFGLRSI